MVARRIIIALLCTVALLGAARRLTSGKPRDVYVEEGDVKMWHRTVTENIGPQQPLIDVLLEVPRGSRINLLFITPDNPEEQKRGLFFLGNRRYSMRLPRYDVGSRIRYALALTRPDGSIVRTPEKGYYVLKFKTDASKPVIVAHVVCMFGAFFFMVLSFFGALRMLRRGAGKRGTVGAARWALIFTIVGTWPLGLVLNRQTFGFFWQGFPFGSDITDNKTQVIFIFWLVSLLLVRGSFFGRGEERDRLGPKGFAWAIVASFVVSLALYLLPHSL